MFFTLADGTFGNIKDHSVMTICTNSLNIEYLLIKIYLNMTCHSFRHYIVYNVENV